VPSPSGLPDGPAPPGRSSRRRRTVVALGAGLLIALAATAVVVTGRRGDGDPAAAPAGSPGTTAVPSTTTTWPATWDERVRFAVEFIERHKGKPFQHPVSVVFLPDAEFEATVSDSGGLDDDGRSKVAQHTGFLRALGVVKGDIDLVDQSRTMARSGILAFYDPQTGKASVRGQELTAAVRATLVHELTHAWQDQYHDLKRLETLKDDSEAAFALRAVTEGDAERARSAWLLEQPPAQQEEYRLSSQTDTDRAREEMRNVSPFLVLSVGAPYTLGTSFLDALDSAGGPERVDAALTTPPRDSATVLAPWQFGPSPERTKVELPPIAPARTTVDEDTMGALDLYLMLADRIDPHLALDVVDTWAGDRFRIETLAGGDVCATGRIVAADGNGAQVLGRAFREWDEAFDGGRVTVSPDATGVTWEACDPGRDAPVTVPGRVAETLGFLVVRLQIWGAWTKQGAPPDAATCGAKTIAELATIEEMASGKPAPPARQRELQQALISRCAR
jgi:hypothetical protein